MKKLADSLLLRDFIDILTADISKVGPDLVFSCRPLKVFTAEQNLALGRFSGRVSLSGVTQFRDALDELVTDRIVKVILDFQRVVLSRSAIGELVAFAANMHGRNKRLYLYRTSDQIKESLKNLGLDSFFTFLESEEDIIVALVI